MSSGLALKADIARYSRQVSKMPTGDIVVLAQHSDQVMNAILSMADRQDLLLAPKVEDLRRKVLELAAIIGRPDPDA
jgi:hypothetical protein